MYEYDDEGEGSGSARRIAGVIAVLIAAAVGWFVVRPAVSDEESAPSIPIADVGVGAETTTSIDDDATPATSGAGAGTTAPDTTTTAEETAAAPTTTGASGAETETTPTSAPSTTQEPTTAGTSDVETETTPTGAPSTTQEEATTTEAPPTTARPRRTDPPATEVPYATLPNGLPEPVIVVFAGPEIRMTGALWSRNASERLAGLALANSATPGAEVDNRVRINPAVPRSVGVRVIELNSARFPTGSAEVLMAHAAQLNRVVTIMNALPHITVDVIGHADQRGSEVGNQQLSAARATAVVNYVVSQGIDPDRLTARGVGETDLLTLNDDEAALALNRRTEFVFYGLLQ